MCQIYVEWLVNITIMHNIDEKLLEIVEHLMYVNYFSIIPKVLQSSCCRLKFEISCGPTKTSTRGLCRLQQNETSESSRASTEQEEIKIYICLYQRNHSRSTNVKILPDVPLFADTAGNDGFSLEVGKKVF